MFQLHLSPLTAPYEFTAVGSTPEGVRYVRHVSPISGEFWSRFPLDPAVPCDEVERVLDALFGLPRWVTADLAGYPQRGMILSDPATGRRVSPGGGCHYGTPLCRARTSAIAHEHRYIAYVPEGGDQHYAEVRAWAEPNGASGGAVLALELLTFQQARRVLTPGFLRDEPRRPRSALGARFDHKVNRLAWSLAGKDEDPAARGRDQVYRADRPWW